jgi:electron transfer flavoprotein beta subunit
MKIAVLMKDVPDLVEDLELNGDGTGLDVDSVSYVPSEWDEQALEEALLVKEESGATVTAVAIDTGDVDTMLYGAVAKGADEGVKITGDFDRTLTNRARAQILVSYLKDAGFDLILTGVQAVDDLDGQLAGLAAGLLGVPHASVVRDLRIEGGESIHFIQEYAGGRMAEFRAAAPLLLGIQAARKPPRYVPVARVRQVSKSTSLTEHEGAAPAAVGELAVRRLYRPEAAARATMWEGDAESVADEIAALLADRKLLRS